MNTNGVFRGFMSKNLSGDDFLQRVASSVEYQLKEWNENYEVFVMKFSNYLFSVKLEETYYEVSFTEHKLNELQNKSPYSLDRFIWLELQKVGLEIQEGNGNYLDVIGL